MERDLVNLKFADDIDVIEEDEGKLERFVI